MSPMRLAKQPPIFGATTKNFSHWKKTMINYLNILEVWPVVVSGYTPKYSTTEENKDETYDSKCNKKHNNLAINAIFNAVSESVALIFGDTTSAKDMWNALINRYEGNTQIKRTKITGLETKLETFKVEDGESIEDMYNRLMLIQNEFIELGEPLSNDKIVGKLLRVMLRKPRWEGLVSALEAIQGTHTSFTPDELYAHFRSFEEKLIQSGELKHESKSKTMAFPAQNRNHPSSSNNRLSNDQFINKIDHESSKNALLLSKMFQGMLDFERKYNKEREEKNKRVMCFACHREGHTIQTCFKLFPHMKSSDGDGQQDRKPRQKYDGYKNKKKAQAMKALLSDESEVEESDTESENEQEINLALMAILDESPPQPSIDVNSIISSKNITDQTTINILLDIARSKNIKLDENESKASTSSTNEVAISSR